MDGDLGGARRAARERTPARRTAAAGSAGPARSQRATLRCYCRRVHCRGSLPQGKPSPNTQHTNPAFFPSAYAGWEIGSRDFRPLKIFAQKKHQLLQQNRAPLAKPRALHARRTCVTWDAARKLRRSGQPLNPEPSPRIRNAEPLNPEPGLPRRPCTTASRKRCAPTPARRPLAASSSISASPISSRPGCGICPWSVDANLSFQVRG